MQNFFLLFCVTLSNILILASAAESPPCKLGKPEDPWCGVRGHAKRKKIFGQVFNLLGTTLTVNTVERCADVCARREYSDRRHQVDSAGRSAPYHYWCAGFSFNTETRLCTISGAPVDKRTVARNQSSNTVFYKRECFDCGRSCPQPFGQQLLDNGGFEKGYGPWQGDEFSEVYKGYHSDLASKVGYMLQQMNFCTRHLYVIQFDYLPAKSSARESSFSLSFGDRGDDGYYNYFPDDNLGLQTFSTEIKISPLHVKDWRHSRIYVPYGFERVRYPQGPSFVSSIDEFILDNVKVSRVPSNPRIKQGATSLLVNGDWETGTTMGWEYKPYKDPFKNKLGRVSPSYTVVSPGIDSKYALSFDGSEEDEGNYLTQRVTTQPNTTYLYSFDAQVKNHGLVIYSRITSPHLHGNGRLEYGENFLIGNHTFSVPVYAQGNSLDINFRVETTNRALGSVLMDNFRFVEVDNSEYFP